MAEQSLAWGIPVKPENQSIHSVAFFRFSSEDFLTRVENRCHAKKGGAPGVPRSRDLIRLKG
jgi:hypothetical protein